MVNKLRLSKFIFTLRFKKRTVLPPFMGDTVRGALLQVMFDNFPDAYSSVFKTEPAVSIPNPYVLTVPYPGKCGYAAGDTLDCALTLFGSACDFAGDAISAVQLMCRGKLAGAEPIRTEQVYDREWSDGERALPYTDTLSLRFHTPTQIRSHGNAVMAPDFYKFIDSLFRRICGIIDNYTDGEFVVPYSLVAARPEIKGQYEVEPVKYKTSSHNINGFFGTIRYFGDVTRYMPYIELGSQIHIGKGGTGTCGEYSYEI